MRSGPAPDPQALRRDRDGHEWLTLPASGLQHVPEWPLVHPTQREDKIWRDLWLGKPQAHEWERLGLGFEVALYVRKLVEAEKDESTAAVVTLVRQFADSLGLTVGGLQRNKWRISGDEVKAKRTAGVKRQRRQGSARDRLRVVPPAVNE